MKFTYTLPVGQVVGLGFVVVLILALLIGLIGRVAYDISNWQNDLSQRRSEVDQLTLELQLLAIRRTDTLQNFLDTHNEDYLSTYRTYRTNYKTVNQQLAGLLTTPEERQALQNVIKTHNRLDDKAVEVVRLYLEDFPVAASFLWTKEGLTLQNNLIEAIDELRFIQGNMTSEIVDQARQTETVAVWAISLFIFILLIGGATASYLITRSITRPISHLVKTTAAIGNDLSIRVDPVGPQEIAFLGSTINDMAASLAASNQALQYHKDLLQQEIDLASHIQDSFLPVKLPTSPKSEIALFRQSARELGGDFYLRVELNNHRWGLIVGDVSGKGASAAMAGAVTLGLLEAYAPEHPTPESLLNRLNNKLCKHFYDNHMNVACCYAIFDDQASTMTVANAGLIPPYLRRQEKLHELEVYGMPLGAWPDFTYVSQTISLCANDLIFVCSDGLIEAQNKQTKLFGFERVAEELLSLPANISAQGVIDQLLTVVETFIEGTPLHDDVTLIAVKIKS